MQRHPFEHIIHLFKSSRSSGSTRTIASASKAHVPTITTTTKATTIKLIINTPAFITTLASESLVFIMRYIIGYMLTLCFVISQCLYHWTANETRDYLCKH